MSKKNLRRINVVVTAQTAYNLDKLAKISGCYVGRIVDKLVREKMIELHEGDHGKC